MNQTKLLGQYPTPVWVAEALVERHFGDLDDSDLIVEPSCGPGAFLSAIPSHVRAVGVEIDGIVAEQARRNTGRDVLVGDFRHVDLDVRPTVILGNPPFNMKVVDGFLHRAQTLLPEGGRVGFILPAYAFQTAARVAGYAEHWSLMQEMIPRNIYPGLSLPLVFAMFSKDRRRTLVGFALYKEAADVLAMPAPYREALSAGAGPVWRVVVEEAMRRLGGDRVAVDYPALYAEIEGRKPSLTKFWKEKVRQTLARHSDRFRRVAPGCYQLATASLIA